MSTPFLHHQPSKSLVIAAFAAVYIIWGSTYLGILYAIKSIPPFFMAGSRFLIAGTLLFCWCLLKGQKAPSLKSFGLISVGGVLMLFVGNGAVTWVEQYLPSGLVAIIVASIPLWFVVFDKRNWKENFSNKKIIIGLLIGFAGVLLLFAGNSSVNFLHDKMKFISFIFLLVGSIGWAIGSLYSKYKSVSGSTTMKAAVQMIAAGIVSYAAGFLTHETAQFSWEKLSGTSVSALLYLILMGSLVGYLSYIWLLSVRPASLVGTYAYVNPVVAVFLGWLIAGEAISLQQVIALTIILGGVLLVNFSKEKKAAKVVPMHPGEQHSQT